MKCLEAQRLIRPYLKRELSVRELDQFLSHVESCADCMEELEISLALQDALEDDFGNGAQSYSIRGQLEADLRDARQYVTLQRGVSVFRIIMVALAEILLVLMILAGIEMRLSSGTGSAPPSGVTDTRTGPPAPGESVLPGETENLTEALTESLSEAQERP